MTQKRSQPEIQRARVCRVIVPSVPSLNIFVCLFLLLLPACDVSLTNGQVRKSRPANFRLTTPFKVPAGIPAKLWRKSIPANNRITAEKVALGELLYFDKRLSLDGSLSCAVCHDPANAFAEHNPLAIGIQRRPGTRNAPTVLNAMFNQAQFWDGRVRSLEEQAKRPLISSHEMGMPNLAAVVARVAAILEYQASFPRAFKREGINIETIVKAIAAFERTQLSANSPFDRFIAGDKDAITPAQKRGWDLFQHKARCVSCHTYAGSSPFFTDFKFHNTGIVAGTPNLPALARQARQLERANSSRDLEINELAHTAGFSELGRFLVTNHAKDIGAFKTPTLRDVELTGPYMHDGSEKTLLDVVRFYNGGGEANSYLDDKMRPLNLSDQEMSDLVEFLRTLTSDNVLRMVQITKPQTRTAVAPVGRRPGGA
jgi:cytochrome c peroxidase